MKKLLLFIPVVLFVLMFTQKGDATVTYKLHYNSTTQTYRVSFNSTVAYNGALARITGSTQVTVVAPDPDNIGIGAFDVINLTNLTALQWAETQLNSPVLNPGKDYLFFAPSNAGTYAVFNVAANTDIDLFSFQTTTACLAPLYLYDNVTDPLNGDPAINADNNFKILGGGNVNQYVGNVNDNTACSCTTFKVVLDPDGQTYRVSFNSGIGFNGALARITGSTQFTIVMSDPDGTGAGIAQVTNITNLTALQMAVSQLNSPVENTTKDYAFFAPSNAGAYAVFNIAANTEIELFTFKITGNCSGDVYLYDNEADPLNANPFINADNNFKTLGGGNVNLYCSNSSGIVPLPDPSITLGSIVPVCPGASTASLPYSATTGGPDQYSIDFDAAAEAAGFTDVLNATLPANTISITVPGAAVCGTYTGTLTVRNSGLSCVSDPYTITVTLQDNTNPVITTCPPTENYAGCGTNAITSLAYSASQVTVSAAQFMAVGGVATDGCGIVSYKYSDTQNGTCPMVITRQWRIADACGNFVLCNQTINVDDNVNPTASNPAPVAVQCIGDVPASNIAVVTDEADNCTANPVVAFVGDVSNGSTCPEIITRTYSVTDACGNAINVTQTITIDDTTNPTASNPAPVAVQCIGDVPVANIAVVTNEADNCTANPTVAFVGDVSDGNTCPQVITRTYSVTDACGNAINVTQTITIDDTTNPTASNPAPVAVQCIGDVTAANIAVVTDEADNCTANPTVAFVGDVSDGNTCPQVITRTYSVTDACGNAINVTQTITIDDTTNPTASNPAPVAVQCIGDVPASNIAVVTDEADNCTANPTVAFVGDVSDGNTCPQVITRTYSVTDACGNAINVTQTITIDDTTNPTASNPAPVSVQCIGDVPASDIAVVTDEADNCTANPVVAFVGDVSNGSTCPEIITRTYSVTDACGNAINVTQTITIDDTTNPTASNPAPVSVQCIGDVPASNIAVVTDEADNCTANPTVAFVGDVSDGNTCPQVITRTYSVTDACGNAINVTQTITIDDTTNPTASNPAPVAVQCIGDVPASNIAVVTDEADNCTANPTVAFVGDVSDGNTCPQVITRTYSVTDACGNAINVTQTITIDDTTNPTASNPAPVSVQCIGDVPASDIAVVTDEADNCTANPVVAFVGDVSNGSTCPEIITRTYSVTDACGNAINVTQTITIDDTTNPTASNPAPVSVQCIGDVPASNIAVVTDEADNCTANPTVAFVGDVSDGNTCPQVITRTYSVTDACGNAINVTQTITIDDTTNPTASNPAPITVQCIGDVPASNIAVVTDEADNCTANPIVTFIGDVSDGNTCPQVITRTYSVTDACGNAINVTQTITIDDTTNPTASNPAPVAVQCIGDVPASNIAVVTDEADNCTANPVVAFVSDISNGSTCPEIITRTYSVTDACGNAINVTQTITIDDTTNPTASNPAPVAVQCIGDVPASNIAVVTDEADNCTANPVVAFVSDISNGSTCPEIITRTYSVTDACGNAINVTQTITIDDTTNPTASNPAPVAVQCIGDVPASNISVVTDEADNCTANPVVAFVGDVSDGNTCPQVITRTYSVTDACGNAINVTQTITIDDTTNPTASNPAPVAVQCIGDVPASNIAVVTDEADNCTANPTVAFVGDVSDGNTCPQVITRTYSVTDACGNAINVTQTITIDDTTNPTASNPAPITVQCIGDVPASNIAVVTDEADNCTANPIVAFVGDVSDGNTCPQVITRTYSVTDACGNAINVTQTITIDDTTNPTASNPAPVAVQCIGDVPASNISVVTDEADNCTANPVVAFVGDVSDGNTCPQVITRTYSVTDACGNAINVTQTITIDDTTNPTASNPAPVAVQCIGDVPASNIAVVTDEADNCTANPTVAFVGDVSDGNTCPQVITRTYSVTDACGNAINVTQTITIDDTTNPTASNPAPITVQCIGDVPASNIAVVTDEADNCTANPVVAFVGDVSNGSTCPEIITRTYSVTDACGNAINVTQTITIDDTTNPTASNPAPVAVQCIGDVPASNIAVVTDEADNCTANPTVAFVGDVSDGNTCPQVITRTYSVTDACGNAINVTQTITIDDTTNPTASNPAPVAVQCIGDVPVANIAVVTNEADNCTANPTVTFVGDVSDGNTCPQVITRTYSVTDACGNAINVTQTITIDDTTNPTASNPAPVTVQCIGDVPASNIAVVTDEADNCTANPVVAFVSDISNGSTCPEIITRTYSVTDACGNAINVTQTITIDDTTNPTASNPAPVSVQCIGDVPASNISVVTDEADNCTANPVVAFVGDVSDGNTCPQVITRTYSVTDACGNAINVTQTITIDDTTNPTASNPAPVTVQCIGDVPASNIAVVTDEADNCTANPTVAFVGDVSDGNTCPQVITRTYSVTDACGNAINVTQTITIDDTTNPTASNPAPVSVQCIGDVPASNISVVTDEADNCTANPVVAFVGDVSDGNTCPQVITRTYSVTDACGNAINVTQTITIDDTTNPTASNPAPVAVQCIGDVPASNIAVVTDEADNCTANPVVAFVGDVSNGSTCPEIITRTYSVTDACGNAINVTQTITIDDTTNPTASNPAPVAVQCIGDVPASNIAVVTDEADNCTANPVVAFVGDVSNGSTCPEIITRTYSVTDACGNAINVTQTITIDDTTNPTASNPAPIAVQCIGDVPASNVSVVTDEADNCTANPTVAFVGDVSDGNTCPQIITRTYSVTDACGNAINVTQTITIDDTTNPTASNPAPVTVQCIGDVPASNIAVVTDEADNCTANPVVAFVGDISNGSTCPEIITRTYSVTDACGNAINVTQTITIDDTTNPTASNPASVAVQCIGDVPASNIAVVTDEADNCTANPVVAFVGDVSNGSTCPEIITRTYSVTDACGNAINVTQTITIDDTTNPTASNPAPIAVQCIGDVPASNIAVVTDEADNCTANPTVAFVGDVSDGNTCPQLITRTYSVTDACGNAINVTQTITIDDTTNPTASNPAPVAVQCIGDVPASNIAVVTDEADNCTANPVVAFVGDVSNGSTCPEIITRTYSVTDACGNAINVTQTITIDDTTNPTASNPASVAVQCIGDVPASNIAVVTDEADNCTANPVVAFVGDVSNGSTCPEIITRTYSVTDACGNAINVTQTITIDDTTNPTASNPAPVAVQCIGDVPASNIAVVTDEADNCTANPTVAFVGDVSDGNTCPQVITRTYSVTDACGNAINVTQTITIDDTTNPTASNPAPVAVQCIGDVPASNIAVVTDEADNCTANPVVAFVGDVSNGSTCPEIITRTYSVTDACGNAINVTQTITIDDTTNPTFSAPANTTVYTDANCAYNITPGNTGDVTDEADNCAAGLNATFNDVVTPGACPGAQLITRTWSLSDLCGNAAADQVQIITVLDNSGPVLTQGSISPYYPNIAAAEAAALSATGASDNCSTTLISAVNTTGNCPATITVTFTDECGNSTNAVYTTNIHDIVLNPQVAFQPVCVGGSILVKGNATGGSAPLIHSWSIDLASTASGAFLSATNLPDAIVQVFTAGTLVLNYTVTDQNGCSTSSLVSIAASGACGEIGIVDPCSCNNDAAVNGDNGTFSELVAVSGPGGAALPAGQIWTIQSIVGAFTDDAAAGPGATGAAVSAGTLLTFDPGAQNYFISFDHVDAQGYTVTVEGPNAAGTAGNFFLNISNTCFYPHPVLVGPLTVCSGSRPFIVEVQGIDASANTVAAPFDTDNDPSTLESVNWLNGVTGSVDPGANDFPGGTVTIFYHYDAPDAAGTSSPGCSLSVSFTFNANNMPPLSANASATQQVSCYNGSDGAATVVVNGGTAAYTYLWSNGETTTMINNLTEGIYEITATDASGCTAMASVVISEPSQLLVTPATLTHVLCAGAATGSAIVAVSGGTPTYTYDWNGNPAGDGSGTITGLSAGTYTLTVTDAQLCVATTSLTITAPNALVATLSGTNPGCAGSNNGSVEAEANGGAAPYQFSLNGGAYQNSNVFPGLIAGNYTVTVKDVNGCTLNTNTVLLTEPNAVSANINSSVNPTCNLANGSATVTASGGTAPYTYAWTNGSADITATDLAAGLVGVTVTDANGCTANTSIVLSNVADVVLPVIACPANISVGNDVDECGANVTYSIPTATDDCPGVSVALEAGDLASGALFPLGVNTVTFIATDATGNTASCEFTINVSDNQTPTAVCQNITIDLDASGNATIVAADVNGGSSDNCPASLSYAISNNAFDCSNTGNNNITLTITDGNSNVSTCIATVTVRDVTAPSFTCPTNITLTSCTDVVPNVINGIANEADNCGIPVLTQNPAPGLAFGAQTSITVTATDASGNTATCAVTVTITDDTDPVIACPANISVGNDVDECGANVTYSIPTATDDCPGVSVALEAGDMASGALFSLGVNTVTFIATDATGNTASCEFTITVSDNQTPTAVCQNITIDLDASGNATIVAADVNGGSSDNCPASLSYAISDNAFDCSNTGDNNVTLTITDGNSNVSTCIATVTVRDVTAPSFTCPANITLASCTDVVPNVLTGITNEADNCGTPTLTQNPAPGLAFGAQTSITVTATDASGNTATCAVTVTITDDTDPVIACPANISVGNNVDECGANVTYSVPTATDDCLGVSVALEAGDMASGALFPLGVNTVTFIATDATGNTASCEFTINVSDNQIPAAVCQNITIDLDASGNATIVAADVNGGSSDNCPASLSFAISDNVFDCSDTGDNNVTLTITDGNSNVSTCIATVTVRDVTAPSFTCPANITLASCTDVVPNVINGITNEADNCGTPTLTQNPAPGLAFGAQTSITVTATDASGNTATCAVTVTITDDTDPVIACPANIFVGNDVDKCGANVTYSIPTATDDCPGVSVALEVGDLASGALFPLGVNTVTFIATDATGNTASCEFTINVSDNQTPTAVCQNITIDLNASGNATIVAADVNGGSSDNCPASLSYAISDNAFVCDEVGDNNVTLTITDGNSNVSTCIATVTVRDVTAPSFTCPANITLASCTDVVPNVINGIANEADNCGIPVLTQNPAPGLAFGNMNGGQTTITVTATDASGNTTTCAVTVTITDDTDPVIACPANIFVGNDVDKCGANVTYSVPTATDDCPGVSVALEAGDLASGALFPIGLSTVNYTATDAGGNTATCAFTVSVSDNQTPTAVCRNITIDLNASGNATIVAADVNGGSSDNCPASLSYAISDNAFDCADTGDNNVTLTVTDGASNVSTCISTVTVRDVTAPSFTCPANITLASCTDVVPNMINGIANEADNCGTPVLTQDPAPGLAFGNMNGGQTTITVTATDASGNTTTCAVTVTITDDTDPLIACPANIFVGNDVDKCGANVTYSVPTATDDCPGASVTLQAGNLASGALFPIGLSTVNYTATDAGGNTATCAFTVSVSDNQTPTAVCRDITIDLNASGNATIVAADVNGGSSDNCLASLSYAISDNAFDCSNTGDNNVTLTITDGASNVSTCISTVTVRDVTAPSFTCPANITLASCTDVVPNVINGIANEADNCGTPVLTQDPAPGLAFGNMNGGQTTITVTATDASGNTTTCAVTVTITDDTDPLIACPANIFVGNDVDECGANVTYSVPTATDDCPGASVTLQAGNLASGALFPIGLSTVNYTATDAGGNTATCAFTVSVSDNQTPTAVCRNITIDLNASGNATIVAADVNGGSSDNCPASLSYAISDNAFDCADTGDNNVTLTITDGANNVSTCVSTVSVRDVTAPVISSCPANVILNDCDDVVPSLTAQVIATDNCGIANLVQNPVAGTDFGQVSGNNVTVTFTVTDVHGNTATCTNTITITDNVAPSFTNCPANITVGNDVDKCGANVSFLAPSASDNCNGVSVSQTSGLLPGAFFPLGITTEIFRATDVNGNTVSCNFTITVTDVQTPTAVCKDITVNLSAATGAGSVLVTAAQINGGSTDNCTFAASLVLAPANTTYTCANVGDNNLTLTVTDGNNNVSTCVATVTVRDLTGPVFTCPAPVTVPSCTSTVPNVIAGLTATDNCGVASMAQNPVAGTDFGQVSGNTVNVTVLVTDLNGNVSTCNVVVTIADAGPPVFVDCPTAPIMIGNDPDQCSGKINWSVPVALDACLPLASVVQTAGPLPGSILPVTCPPTPTTITYRATDGSGNAATCNFQIMVVDTQKPDFDADVIMPTDITVQCNAIPANCVFHGNGLCSPLTASDIQDNCTGPLNVSFNESSTRSANPNACGYYNYVLTRTWTITDCAGNSRQHTQLITVQDNAQPTLVCKNITVSLNDFGTVSIVPRDLDGGSTDGCTANANLLFASQTTFTCADLVNSPVPVTLTVTDPCGNFSTCTALVTVLQGNSDCTPEYDFDGSDPCACLDNATTLDNGQFSELIQIHGLAGQTWTIISSTGLYLASSPAPPAAPVVVPANTLLLNGQVDGINNDGDALTDELDERVYYTFRGRHVDGQGYTALIRSNLNQDITLENKCFYPTPYFADFVLDDPLCLGTPPFTIEVDEFNNAIGTIVPGSVMVNGVPTTVFDAAALGVGNHTVMATFDAGAAQSFTKVNGIVVDGSLAEALADPGCRQKITKIVNVVETPNTLVCNDLVYVSMDADCQVTLGVDDVLEGTYYCYDDYVVEVDKTLPFGNGPWVPAVFTAADLGKTYQYRVVHISGGSNLCWGEIRIEDKLAPILDCPADLTIACSEPTAVFHTGNVVISDCSNTTTVVDDEIVDNGECGDPRQIITRTFIVTDSWGNQSVCTQLITVVPFDLDDVIFPAEITVNCETAYLNPNAVHPDVTGRPSINGSPIGSGGLCSASIGYTDVRLDICAGSYEIYRTWLVANTCLPAGLGNPVSGIQRIRVKDLAGPAFDCPPAVTVSTDPYTCCATAALPDMIISEGCSEITDLEAKVTGVDPNNGNIITFTVPGHLEDFAGNNWWNPDTLAVFNYTQCMPLGVYNVRYKASDHCGNTSYCNFELTIADLVPPVVSCDQVTQVALGNSGMALIDAAVLNDGTIDNCCLDHFVARRMNPNDCQTDTVFHDQVKFCCSDIGDTILVVFRAFDCHGNSNDCMVSVLVEDKIKPTCVAPAQVAVNCENFDPSLWAYGFATSVDNCCLDTITTTTNYALFDTVCNKGTITRTFRSTDCAGNSSSCTQRVIVTYLQDYYIKFPNDAIVTTCDGTGLFGEPSFFGEDCELLGVTYADQIFTVVPDACFKIEREWSIINWCTFNPNLDFVYVPNPSPNAISNHATNLPGPTVSACGTLQPWKSTVVKILPTDPLPGTDYCEFWDQNANGYRYKQIIKITDTQAPTGTYVVPSCDNQNWFTPNNSALWNESYWWDNGLQIHDLCEEPTDLCITATDACSGSNVNVEYLLFLDLDGNGSMETVINSVNTGIAGLGWNNVLYNNLSTPNFAGGTPRAFDGRPVPQNMKYGFAIQETVAGLNKTVCVRWNTQQQQNTYVIPELPHGTHKIKWFITDGCGNNKEYEYTFTVKDCKAPTVVCLNGLSVNIMPTSMIQLWASDFLQYTEDNCTPAGQIKIGIRKCGTGTGFPVDAQGNPITNVIFDCTELGTQCVELWAIDAAGNADYCETYVIVQDNLGNCPNGDKLNVVGALKTEMTEGVEEGMVHIDGTSTFAPPYAYFDLSDTSGLYAVTNSVPLAATFVIAPEKDDNPLNGVTTYDLVLISKHILGLEPLNSPYKMIAADANKSGSVTTFDIVELRKLILGIYTELPNNTSWRFVDKAFQFPNVLNPFETLFPETISVADAMTTQAGEDFVGVKVGDVNNTVVANATMQAESRNSGTAIFDLEDREVSAGDNFEVTFKAAQALQGFQFTLLLHGLEVTGIQESDRVSASNFGLIFEDAATVSIDGAQAFTLRFRASKSGKLSEMLGISGSITRAEAYPVPHGGGQERALGVAFRFGGKTIAGLGFELYQNQPNPFMNKTSIGFYLPEAAEAILSVFDESGRVVYQQKGRFAKGENLFVLERSLLNTTGMLYYKVETADHAATRSMIQVKK